MFLSLSVSLWYRCLACIPPQTDPLDGLVWSGRQVGLIVCLLLFRICCRVRRQSGTGKMPSRVVGSSSWAPGSDHTQGLAHHSLPGPRGFLRRGDREVGAAQHLSRKRFSIFDRRHPLRRWTPCPALDVFRCLGSRDADCFLLGGVRCSAVLAAHPSDHRTGERERKGLDLKQRRQTIAGRAAAPLRAVAWHRRGLNSPSVSLPPVVSHGWSLLPSRRLVLGHAAALPPPAMITDLLPTAHAAHVERQNSSPATGLSISFLFPHSSPLDTRAVLFTAVAVDNRPQGASHGSRPRPSGVIRFGSPRGLCKS
ncbi:hypothetical protein B0T11DRAFT_82231 [Plectosphaerella cucumerina]|uniref:Uncharacterized protein n=1 Tax=Plectosphaerella cucumerina TaxID=40658 RepID=A0A8K0TGD8_9PEZI|nr:hypothetical protein B0T11DRAFT_82231 [Plectosphaerella cucumerina]